MGPHATSHDDILWKTRIEFKSIINISQLVNINQALVNIKQCWYMIILFFHGHTYIP